MGEDERLRELERGATRDAAAAVQLSVALERLGRPAEAARALVRAARDLPPHADVAHALARLRGPARGGWSTPLGDASKTRRSTSRGPRGRGVAKAVETEGGLLHQDERPPLVGPGGRVALTRARAESGRAVREVPLAFAADGTLYALEDGALVAREPDGNPPPFARRELGDAREVAWAAVLDDASIIVAHERGVLARLDPWGGDRHPREPLLAALLGIAHDPRAARVYTIAIDRGGRRLLACDHSLQRLFSLDLPLEPCDPPLVADDGRIVVLGPFGRAAVVSPAGMIERELRYGERIGGARAALGPRETLAVVAWDRGGAVVTLFDLATGERVSGFQVLRGYGAPALDADNVLYLRAGEPSRVVGHDLATGEEVFRVERPGVRDDQPKTLALGDGEVVFVEVPDGGPPRLVRATGAR